MLSKWLKEIRRTFLWMLACCVLFGLWTAAPASAAQEQTAQEQTAQQTESFKMVSLGDSLTAGYEPGMDLQSVPYGFVDRLKEQGWYHGRTEAVNLGINGLKTNGLRNYVQAIADGRALTADELQAGLKDPRAASFGAGAAGLKPVLAEADLITITIGGNDLFELIRSAGTLSDEQLAARVQELFSVYTENMTNVLDNLIQINPEAVILLADQYQPVPEIADKAAYPKLMQTAQQFTGIIDGLAAAYQSKGAHVKTAHVAKEFVGAELTMTHIMKEDIHPNQYGYETMARVFSEAIWGVYHKPAVREEGEPMAVYVRGTEIETPYKPVLVKNQNFVAVQDIVNAIGASTKWSNKTSTAEITYGGKKVAIQIGADTVVVNGTPVSIPAPAFLHKVGKEHKTYVPLAVIASGLGFDVQYNKKLKAVFINP